MNSAAPVRLRVEPTSVGGARLPVAARGRRVDGASAERLGACNGWLTVGSWLMSERLVWARDGRDWPNRDSSRFVRAAGLSWHVQQMGSGPGLLLVHGTGAATHSWRGLAPLLARRFTVIAPDLPGHGFTDPLVPREMSLPGMASALHALVDSLGIEPELVVGHSAGAAILARMSLDGRISPRALVSLNGALLPLPGLAGLIFPPAAKLLARNPLVPRLFAWRGADRFALQRLIDSTGSRIDPAGVELYRRLIGSPGHVAGALAMMASWNLWPLEHDLPRLKPPLMLVVGSNDRTVSPREAHRVKALLPRAVLVSLDDLGHLAHEERPEAIGRLIVEFASSTGLLVAPTIEG